MKPRFAIACLFTSCAALAAQEVPPAQDYHYGEKLDIKHVVQAPDLDFCGIREVEMTYEDSAGQRHTLRYPVWGQGCGNEN
ncbi:DUF2790 domain-containing protein [Pseudomonas sp. NY15435]|uniref:DUF2790 domain-containing protein n=1 Tax=Pseudomonas sp. NY15435 TaxID=3400358 RepID=UPI003A8A1517